jgi:hypothetical protein
LAHASWLMTCSPPCFAPLLAPRAFGDSVESPRALGFLDFARFFAKNRFPLFRCAL